MSATPMRVNGRHVLFWMLAFFATVLAVNVAFIVLALQSFPGEDVRRSYLQGLNYNATLEARRAQAALGWSAVAALIEENGAAAVEVRMRDRDGAAIDGLAASGELRWPTSERLDHSLTFEPRGEGRYVARVAGLAPGRWALRARVAQSGERAFDFEAELAWPPSR